VDEKQIEIAGSGSDGLIIWKYKFQDDYCKLRFVQIVCTVPKKWRLQDLCKRLIFIL